MISQKQSENIAFYQKKNVVLTKSQQKKMLPLMEILSARVFAPYEERLVKREADS